eukprot:m.114816 g.114816  ORF g.114816 m.114816 type:complete len:637 (-) comp19370_c0_seq1:581-2491(-)
MKHYCFCGTKPLHTLIDIDIAELGGRVLGDGHLGVVEDGPLVPVTHMAHIVAAAGRVSRVADECAQAVFSTGVGKFHRGSCTALGFHGVIANVVRVVENPIRCPFHIVVRHFQGLEGLGAAEAHGFNHGHVIVGWGTGSSSCTTARSCNSRGFGGLHGLSKVRITHVLHDPLHGSLKVAGVFVDGLATAVDIKAHSRQALHHPFVHHRALVLRFWQWLFARLAAAGLELGQVQQLRHVQRHAFFLAGPVLAQVELVNAQQEIAREGGHGLGLQGSGFGVGSGALPVQHSRWGKIIVEQLLQVQFGQHGLALERLFLLLVFVGLVVGLPRSIVLFHLSFVGRLLQIHRQKQVHVAFFLAVSHLLGGSALQTHLRLELKEARDLRAVGGVRGPVQLRQQVLQVVHGVLLLVGGEFGMATAHQRLEAAGRHTVLLQARVGGLRVFAREHTFAQLGHLSFQVVFGVGRAALQGLVSSLVVPLLNFRQAEQNLQHRVHVARVAEVLEAREARARLGHQLFASLFNAIHLETQVLVERQLQLYCRSRGLLHLHHVDAKVLQVLGQQGVQHHVVFSVREHVGALWRDGTQLDTQGEVGFLVVLQCMPVALGAAHLLAATENRAVRHVEPQVLRQVAPRAFPPF